MSLITNYFAQAYGAGTYDSSAYQASTSTTQTASGSGSATSSGGATLTNTGFDILLTSTIAAAIIFSALVIRFWKRPAKTAPKA